MMVVPHCWLRFTIIIMWIAWTTALFTEDLTIKVVNVSYTSQHMQNCWFHFKYYNITCDHIDLSINGTVVLDRNGYILPVMNFRKSEGFQVEGCQAVLMRCYKDHMDTHYKIQGVRRWHGPDGNWIIWVFVVILSVILVCVFLGLAVYYRKAHCWDIHSLPVCCESHAKVPIEDPAVEPSLCESQETLQSKLTGCADPSSCRQSICLSSC